jgi:hypothetical protein
MPHTGLARGQWIRGHLKERDQNGDQPMIESWKQSALIAIGAVAAILSGGGLQAWSLAHRPAQSEPASGRPEVIVRVVVETSGGPAMRTFTTSHDALAYASANTGVDWPDPTDSYPGYGVVLIEVPVAESCDQRRVLFTIRNGNALLTIVEVIDILRIPGSGCSWTALPSVLDEMPRTIDALASHGAEPG